MHEMKVQKWLESLPEGDQAGFAVAMAIAAKWYSELKEAPNGVHAALIMVTKDLSKERTVRAVIQCLRVICGAKRYPEAPQRFLDETRCVVLYALRTFVLGAVNAIYVPRVGPLTKDQVDGVIDAMLVAQLISESDLGRQIEEDVHRLVNDLDVRVISVEVQEYARAYLASGEVAEFHPAFDFLSQIVEEAPNTRLLPDKMSAALEAFMNAEVE